MNEDPQSLQLAQKNELAVPTDKDPQITNSNVQGFKIEKQEPRLSEPFKINLVETSEFSDPSFSDNKIKVKELQQNPTIKFEPVREIKPDPLTTTLKLKNEESLLKFEKAKHFHSSDVKVLPYLTQQILHTNLPFQQQMKNIQKETTRALTIDTMLNSLAHSSSKKRKREEKTFETWNHLRSPLQPLENFIPLSEHKNSTPLETTITTSSVQNVTTLQQTSIQFIKPRTLPLTPLLGTIELNPVKVPTKSEGVKILSKQIESKEVCLYLGNAAVAANYGWLKEKEIGCIINVAKEIRNYFETTGKFRYVKIPAVDGATDPLIEKHLDFVCRIISDSFLKGISILVHCKAGQSRSVAVVLGYLLQCESFTLERALSLLSSEKHVEMKLNEGFKKQLTQLEFKIYGIVTYDFFDIGVRKRRPTQKFEHQFQPHREKRNKRRKVRKRTQKNTDPKQLTIDSFVVGHTRFTTNQSKSNPLESITKTSSDQQPQQQQSSLLFSEFDFANEIPVQEFVLSLERPSPS